MKISEAIAAVFEGTGKSSDDYPVRKRFVYNELKNAYKELVRQDMNEYRMWDGANAQTLECIRLVRTDAASCLNCESGIFMLRSETPIPEIIETDYGPALTNVFLMNGRSVEKYNDRSSAVRDLNRRYRLPDSFGYLLVNRYICVLNYDDVDELIVNAEGFYGDPESIYSSNSTNQGCSTEQACLPVYEYDFSCPGHLLRRVIEITRLVVFRKLGIPLDLVNNAKPDPQNVQSETSSRG